MRLIVISVILGSVLFLAGCRNEHGDHDAVSDSYYTCPMHPSVVSNSPGSCPVCNMSLIKVEKNQSNIAGQQGNSIPIDKRRQQLAGIKTDTVKLRILAPTSSILGTVVIDEQQVKTISSRAKGRIDRLFVNTTGVYLRKASPLYSIYSEQLLADEKEYLTLYENFNAAGSQSVLATEMLSAAKNKLLLWGLSEKQILALEKSGASPLITFYSNESGYVSEVSITEGMYVDEGIPLIKITALNHVWVEAQLYANEPAKATNSTSFHIYSENLPDEVYKGTLVYNNPVIEAGRRVQLLRLRVDNAKGKLIPGMMVSVNPQKATQSVLAVPKSAILLEQMKTAWVKTGEDMFEQRMIETGAENKYWIEIVAGLKPGDILVTEGAYLISSEFILKSGAKQRHAH